MKVKAFWNSDKTKLIYPGGIYIKKMSDNMTGVFDQYNTLITSSESFNNACKKAKLISIGYMIRKEEQEVEGCFIPVMHH